MSYYSYDDVKRNAVRRTNRLQYGCDSKGENEKTQKCVNEETGSEKTESRNSDSENKSHESGLAGFLKFLIPESGFKPDGDTLLVLMFIWILYKNGADLKILIALGYILL